MYIPSLFFQLDNWANDLLMIVAGIVLIGAAVFAMELWIWLVAETFLAVYQRLHYRAQQVGLLQI